MQLAAIVRMMRFTFKQILTAYQWIMTMTSTYHELWQHIDYQYISENSKPTWKLICTYHVEAVFSHVSMIHTASFRIASCPLFIVLVGAVKSTCMYYTPLWCMVLIETTLKVQLELNQQSGWLGAWYIKFSPGIVRLEVWGIPDRLTAGTPLPLSCWILSILNTSVMVYIYIEVWCPKWSRGGKAYKVYVHCRQ